jgi:hypothetical protein
MNPIIATCAALNPFLRIQIQKRLEINPNWRYLMDLSKIIAYHNHLILMLHSITGGMMSKRVHSKYLRTKGSK